MQACSQLARPHAFGKAVPPRGAAGLARAVIGPVVIPRRRLIVRPMRRLSARHFRQRPGAAAGPRRAPATSQRAAAGSGLFAQPGPAHLARFCLCLLLRSAQCFRGDIGTATAAAFARSLFTQLCAGLRELI